MKFKVGDKVKNQYGYEGDVLYTDLTSHFNVVVVMKHPLYGNQLSTCNNDGFCTLSTYGDERIKWVHDVR